METTAKKRLSKFSTEPILDGDGEPIFKSRLTALEDRMIEPLARRRFLTAPYIAKYAGTSADYVTDVFKVLKREPNCYVKVADWQTDNPRFYQSWPHYYELGRRGEERLEVRKVEVLPRSYQGSPDHQVMLDQAVASCDFAAMEYPDELRLITWATIRSSPNLSSEARAAAERDDAHSIPVEVKPLGSVRVEADDRPFGYELKRKGSYIFFPGFEVEYARKRKETGKFNVQSERLKFLKHAAVIERGVYKSYFGFRSYYVPFIFANLHDMKASMQQLDRMIARGEIRPQTAQFILFKTQPAPGSYDKASPTGHMATEPWQRVGNQPFNFLRS